MKGTHLRAEVVHAELGSIGQLDELDDESLAPFLLEVRRHSGLVRPLSTMALPISRMLELAVWNYSSAARNTIMVIQGHPRSSSVLKVTQVSVGVGDKGQWSRQSGRSLGGRWVGASVLVDGNRPPCRRRHPH